ncbi:MAG: peptide deformylase, partial [bacterium]
LALVRADVLRPERVKVRAFDENGRELELEAEGLDARCLQHEIDHLEGRLFIDRLNDARRMLVNPQLKRLEKEYAR